MPRKRSGVRSESRSSRTRRTPKSQTRERPESSQRPKQKVYGKPTPKAVRKSPTARKPPSKRRKSRPLDDAKRAATTRRARGTVDAGRRPPPKKLIPRAAQWWRAPLTAHDLKGIEADERAVLIAQERLLKEERVKRQIRELREFSKDFTPENGYSLRDVDVRRLTGPKLRKLRDAHEQLVRAKSRPFIEVKPRGKRQLKKTLQRAGKILPGQRKYLIHHPDAKIAQARFVDGELELYAPVKGGEIRDRLYLFDRKPRSWKDVQRMTAALQKRGMQSGNYKLVNSLYGAIGQVTALEKLQEELDEFFSTYNKWMAGTILGWRWYGSNLDKAFAKQRREKTVVERFKEKRAFSAYKEKRREQERLGIAKRCRYCGNKKCKCTGPEY
jgi:hypothetical protein